MLKKIIATILTVALFVTGMSVTSFAASTKDYGYTIINTNEPSDSWDLNRKVQTGFTEHSHYYQCVYLHNDKSGIYGTDYGALADGQTVSLFYSDKLVEANAAAKCYFKNAAEKKWHRFKNWVKITKSGTYQVKYVWSDNKGKRSDVVEFHVQDGVPIDVDYDMVLADTKSVTIRIGAQETPTTARYYYTTDGSKPTTKSKEYKLVSPYAYENEFTFKKSCTFRMLITCPGHDNTYLHIPICIGKEYTVNLRSGNLKDGAFCTAVTGVFRQPLDVKFFKGYDETYKFYYTLDGSKPTTKSTSVKYRCEYVTIDKSCTLRVLVIDANGKKTYGVFRYIIDGTQALEGLY